MRQIILSTLLFLFPALAFGYDLVIKNGRVLDPESGLDAVRNVGIDGDRIVAVSKQRLSGDVVVDASGLVVAPGFIDLHAHGQDPRSSSFQVTDGVTTAIEGEIGVLPVGKWLESQRGKSRPNYGATASHLAARVQLLTGIEPGHVTYAVNTLRGRTSIDWANVQLGVDLRNQMYELLEQGVEEGGLGLGLGITYTPGATHEEIYGLFRLAKSLNTPIFVHMRDSRRVGGDRLAPLQEVVSNAAATGASLHVVHINSSLNEDVQVAMEIIRGARANGVDVTTEAYPYTAGSTRIESAAFDNFRGDYGLLQWTLTGERLTKETFDEYRQTGGWVISHGRSETTNTWITAQEDIIVASDGVPFVGDASHPRGAGTYARVLGHYVRDLKALSLMTALSKMTLLPAKRLEVQAPSMRRKGRVQKGADADLVVFSAEEILDRATYTVPARTSSGIVHVLVNGEFVVKDSALVEDAFPGRPIKAGT